MDSVQFESLCRKSGYDPIPKRFTPDGNILLAEKTRFDPSVHPHPWVETLWAIEREGCDWANLVRNDFAAVVNGLARTITREDRINDAVDQAKFMLGCLDRGKEKAKAIKR